MTVVIGCILAVLWIFSLFCVYWVGKDQGEKAGIWYARMYDETLDKLNKTQRELALLRMGVERYDRHVFDSIMNKVREDGDYMQ